MQAIDDLKAISDGAESLATIKAETAALLFISRNLTALRVRLFDDTLQPNGDDLIVIAPYSQREYKIGQTMLVTFPNFSGKRNIRMARILNVLDGFWSNINLSEGTDHLCWAARTVDGIEECYRVHLVRQSLATMLRDDMRESGKRVHLNGVEVPHETAKLRYCELVAGAKMARLEEYIAEAQTITNTLINQSKESNKVL